MNKAFEKIFERLERKIFSAELYNNEFNGKTVDNLICLGDVKDVIDEIEEEYNNGWIPCSERLPDAGKRYLVSVIWKDKDFEKSAVYDAVYGSDGLWHSYNYEHVSYKVIAWQPLPEPYQPKGE